MITTRKPNVRELSDLSEYLQNAEVGVITDDGYEEEVRAKTPRAAEAMVRKARSIVVFENYPFQLSARPNGRQAYDEAVIFVIWDDNPYTCQVFLHGKHGMVEAVGDGSELERL